MAIAVTKKMEGKHVSSGKAWQKTAFGNKDLAGLSLVIW